MQKIEVFQQDDYPLEKLIRNEATLRFDFAIDTTGTKDSPTFRCAYLIAKGLPGFRRVIDDRPDILYIQNWNGSTNLGTTRATLPVSKLATIAKPVMNPVYIAPHRAISANVAMTSLREVPADGADLPTFLQTLNNENRDSFNQIEDAFCRLFPEFDRIVPKGTGAQVGIVLRRRIDKSELAIGRCGNGLEQALIILTSLFGSEYDRYVLLDEPHNFLHPGAERVLLNILHASGRQIIAATHSPTFINGVASGQITLISQPGESYDDYVSRGKDLPPDAILENIGFRNSDALFHDALVFVEGPSDADVLPILLAKLGLSPDQISNIGFPLLKGVEELRDPDKIRARLALYENLLLSLGKRKQKHIYFFDKDRDFISQAVGRSRIDGHSIPLFFSPMTEMENSLLNASAVVTALRKQAQEDGVSDFSAAEDAVEAEFQRSLATEPKGSQILSRVYADRNLVYDKRRSGKLVAAALPDNDEQLKKLCAPILEMLSGD